jgi:hypothetical protein
MAIFSCNLRFHIHEAIDLTASPQEKDLQLGFFCSSPADLLQMKS